jgi:hypothetical protein
MDKYSDDEEEKLFTSNIYDTMSEGFNFTKERDVPKLINLQDTLVYSTLHYGQVIKKPIKPAAGSTSTSVTKLENNFYALTDNAIYLLDGDFSEDK